MKFPKASFAVLFTVLFAASCHSSQRDESAARRRVGGSQADRGALDGRKYHIEFFGLDGTSQGPSRLAFAKGNFDSSFFRAHGFEPTTYSTSSKIDGIHFEATANSPTNGKNEWHGTVVDDRIEGTLVSTDLHGVVERCRFKGRRGT